MNRIRNGNQRYCGLLSWSCVGNGIHRSCILFFFQLASILPHQHHSRFRPKERYCFQTEMEFELRYCIVHHDIKILMFKTGPILVFLKINPLVRVHFSFRSIVYPRHKCCICCPSSASKSWKNCPISTRFKPASEHGLDSFWLIGQLFEFSLVFLHQISPLLFIGMSFCNGRTSKNLRFIQIIKCKRLLQNAEIFG